MKNKLCPDCPNPTAMVKTGHAAKWWTCPRCGATAPLRSKPTPAPDTSLALGPRRRAFLLRKFGGYQVGIKELIDREIVKEQGDGE